MAHENEAQQLNTLVFNKWDTKDVKIKDLSIVRYVDLKTKVIPHTFGKNSRKRFEKGKVSIVERLINKIMRSGQGKRKLSGKYIRGRGSCGKKLQAMLIVEKAFEKVEAETKQNPIQVLINAIEQSAPREDITRIKRGGITYSQAVDVSPLKRIDESLKNIALAAFSNSYRSTKSAEDCLAEEMVLASKGDGKSYSIKRMDEVERIAKASR